MTETALSFCIPTYNRSQSVCRLVTDILACRDADIEVVVLDNGSTDDTLQVLAGIGDSRLRVFSNGENRGALYNMVHVLDKGTGRFLVYSTDQDYVDSSKIGGFKSFLLQQPGLACGYCEFDSMAETEFELFPAGLPALRQFGYTGRHPTGYFFNNALLKPVRIVERFSDYEFVDLFPLEFVFAELSLGGTGAVYHRRVFSPETGRNVVAHKSSTTDGKSKKAFFSPEARLKMAVNYSRHITTLPIAAVEKRGLIRDVFLDGLTLATIGFRTISANEKLCIHYYMERRDIRLPELAGIGARFTFGYLAAFRRTAEYRTLSGSLFPVTIIWSVFQEVLGRFAGAVKKKVQPA